MKNGNQCVKCGLTDIVKVPGSVKYGTGNAVEVGLGSFVAVTRYVCTGCGFSEEWIDSQIDIQRIKRRYGL
jgi:predicted nucleic-acid-binding Zn-ribbon protein